jgi:putative spermidine/putrescine transport system substrate-binding protein
MQAIGIGYNPRKITSAPKSWFDLWNPAYKGRVGLTALNSSLGMAFMVELARLKGGSESNLEPAFQALHTLLPNVGAMSANLGAHAALIQQEQVDVAVHNFDFIQTLRGKGVDVDWVKPTPARPGGAPACTSSRALSDPTSRSSTSRATSRPRSRRRWRRPRTS